MQSCRYGFRPIPLSLFLGVACAALSGFSVEGTYPNPPGAGAVILSPDPPYEGATRDDLDEYGGWTGLQGTATGFFHTEQVGGRWWLVTPAGNVFFGLGVRDIPHDGSARRLRAWGFNCSYVGAEVPETAKERFPYVLNLKLIRLAAPELPVPAVPGLPPWLTYYDVFDPEWPTKCDEYLEKNLKPHGDDPLMVGYWIENEPTFSGWYEAITRAPLDAPARKAFVEVARAYYAERPDDLVKDWAPYGVKAVEDLASVEGDAPNVPGLADMWQVAMAERTYSVIHDACKKVDGNHLNLGVRMMSAAPPNPGVLAVMGKYCDVISLNLYSVLSDRILTPIVTMTPLVHALTGKPLMVSEFTYRGNDSHLPNTLGAPPSVPTQADRGIGYLSYVSTVASLPFFVGVNWYTYDDDSADRRWDEYGEDCNFGIVDKADRPYAALVEAMRLTNQSIYELAADPVQSAACPAFYRTELTRWDKEWNAEFLRRYARLDKPMPDPLADMFPESRRFHENYWIHHESPSLIVNDYRFLGDAKANIIRKRPGGHELAILGLQYLATFPRSLWFGQECVEPDKTVVLEGNAKVMARDVDADGRVRRLTVVDGSFVRLDFAEFEFRTDAKVAYMDLRYAHDAKTLDIVTRGPVEHLGVRGVEGWAVTWNGKPAQAADFDAPEGMAVLANPGVDAR